MTPEMYFDKAKNFLETKPASQKLMTYLNAKAEIGIFIGNTVECSYFKQGEQPKLEKRKAIRPDVTFHFSPEAVETILKSSGNDLSDLVADVAKLYLAGAVKVKITGSIPQLLVRGYVRVLKESHAKLLVMLKDRGLDSLKIPSIIQKLKSLK